MGVRAIPFGIAAAALGLVLASTGTQAGSADNGMLGAGRSVFGTIHPSIFRLRAPIGAEPQAQAEGVQVASLHSRLAPDDVLSDAPESCLSATFADRFAALEDFPASFEERFEAGKPETTGSIPLPPERGRRVARLPDRPGDEPEDGASRKHPRPGQARDALPDDGRTAIYDISARTVYLPSGRRLEAHSGLGAYMDNPRHVHLRMRGSTPPNVYKLTMRERLFHGVRAIRLNPVDQGRMHGRAGILAHTYMLGPSGQSNGCVSFRNYPEFLNAYLKGEVTRMVVVDRLDSPPPGPKLASGWLPNSVRNIFGGGSNATAATAPVAAQREGEYAAAAEY